uniref:Uncharacterized protein P0784G04.29 n=1 Tax=Oryza sativa subsp. japonica TaxID=39947 RepID=Q5F1V6_ORYSJ|nr:hypothetical protein [Oryza sativa Japonica Group]
MDLVVMMKETHQRWIPVAVWSTSSSPSPSSSPPSPPLAEARQSCLLLPDLAVPRPTTVNSDGTEASPPPSLGSFAGRSTILSYGELQSLPVITIAFTCFLSMWRERERERERVGRRGPPTR